MKNITLDASTFSDNILNVILGLTSLLKKDLTLENVSLKPSFITSVMALKGGTSAYVEGAVEGSRTLFFSPTKHFSSRKISLQTENVYDAFQPLLIPMLFSGHKTVLNLEGKTHTAICPSFEYLREVHMKYLAHYFQKSYEKLHAVGFSDNGNVEVFIQGNHTLENLPSEIKLNYHTQLSGIKLIINTDLDLMKENIVERISDLFKLSFPDTTVSVLPRHVQNVKGLSIDVFALFGEEGSFDNDVPYVKSLSLIPPLEFTLSSSHLQIIILDFIEVFKERIEKDGIDKFLAIDLIPLVGLLGGEIIVQDVDYELTTLAEVVGKILEVEIKIDGNRIYCEHSYKTENLVSIDDI